MDMKEGSEADATFSSCCTLCRNESDSVSSHGFSTRCRNCNNSNDTAIHENTRSSLSAGRTCECSEHWTATHRESESRDDCSHTQGGSSDETCSAYHGCALSGSSQSCSNDESDCSACSSRMSNEGIYPFACSACGRGRFSQVSKNRRCLPREEAGMLSFNTDTRQHDTPGRSRQAGSIGCCVDVCKAGACGDPHITAVQPARSALFGGGAENNFTGPHVSAITVCAQAAKQALEGLQRRCGHGSHSGLHDRGSTSSSQVHRRRPENGGYLLVSTEHQTFTALTPGRLDEPGTATSLQGDEDFCHNACQSQSAAGAVQLPQTLRRYLRPSAQKENAEECDQPSTLGDAQRCSLSGSREPSSLLHQHNNGSAKAKLQHRNLENSCPSSWQLSSSLERERCFLTERQSLERSFGRSLTLAAPHVTSCNAAEQGLDRGDSLTVQKHDGAELIRVPLNACTGDTKASENQNFATPCSHHSSDESQCRKDAASMQTAIGTPSAAGTCSGAEIQQQQHQLSHQSHAPRAHSHLTVCAHAEVRTHHEHSGACGRFRQQGHETCEEKHVLSGTCPYSKLHLIERAAEAAAAAAAASATYVVVDRQEQQHRESFHHSEGHMKGQTKDDTHGCGESVCFSPTAPIVHKDELSLRTATHTSARTAVEKTVAATISMHSHLPSSAARGKKQESCVTPNAVDLWNRLQKTKQRMEALQAQKKGSEEHSRFQEESPRKAVQQKDQTTEKLQGQLRQALQQLSLYRQQLVKMHKHANEADDARKIAEEQLLEKEKFVRLLHEQVQQQISGAAEQQKELARFRNMYYEMEKTIRKNEGLGQSDLLAQIPRTRDEKEEVQRCLESQVQQLKEQLQQQQTIGQQQKIAKTVETGVTEAELEGFQRSTLFSSRHGTMGEKETAIHSELTNDVNKLTAQLQEARKHCEWLQMEREALQEESEHQKEVQNTMTDLCKNAEARVEQAERVQQDLQKELARKREFIYKLKRGIQDQKAATQSERRWRELVQQQLSEEQSKCRAAEDELRHLWRQSQLEHEALERRLMQRQEMETEPLSLAEERLFLDEEKQLQTKHTKRQIARGSILNEKQTSLGARGKCCLHEAAENAVLKLEVQEVARHFQTTQYLWEQYVEALLRRLQQEQSGQIKQKYQRKHQCPDHQGALPFARVPRRDAACVARQSSTDHHVEQLERWERARLRQEEMAHLLLLADEREQQMRAQQTQQRRRHEDQLRELQEKLSRARVTLERSQGQYQSEPKHMEVGEHQQQQMNRNEAARTLLCGFTRIHPFFGNKHAHGHADGDLVHNSQLKLMRSQSETTEDRQVLRRQHQVMRGKVERVKEEKGKEMEELPRKQRDGFLQEMEQTKFKFNGLEDGEALRRQLQEAREKLQQLEAEKGKEIEERLQKQRDEFLQEMKQTKLKFSGLEDSEALRRQLQEAREKLQQLEAEKGKEIEERLQKQRDEFLQEMEQMKLKFNGLEDGEALHRQLQEAREKLQQLEAEKGKEIEERLQKRRDEFLQEMEQTNLNFSGLEDGEALSRQLQDAREKLEQPEAEKPEEIGECLRTQCKQVDGSDQGLAATRQKDKEDSLTAAERRNKLHESERGLLQTLQSAEELQRRRDAQMADLKRAQRRLKKEESIAAKLTPLLPIEGCLTQQQLEKLPSASAGRPQVENNDCDELNSWKRHGMMQIKEGTGESGRHEQRDQGLQEGVLQETEKFIHCPRLQQLKQEKQNLMLPAILRSMNGLIPPAKQQSDDVQRTLPVEKAYTSPDHEVQILASPTSLHATFARRDFANISCGRTLGDLDIFSCISSAHDCPRQSPASTKHSRYTPRNADGDLLKKSHLPFFSQSKIQRPSRTAEPEIPRLDGISAKIGTDIYTASASSSSPKVIFRRAITAPQVMCPISPRSDEALHIEIQTLQDLLQLRDHDEQLLLQILLQREVSERRQRTVPNETFCLEQRRKHFIQKQGAAGNDLAVPPFFRYLLHRTQVTLQALCRKWHTPQQKLLQKAASGLRVPQQHQDANEIVCRAGLHVMQCGRKMIDTGQQQRRLGLIMALDRTQKTAALGPALRMPHQLSSVAGFTAVTGTNVGRIVVPLLDRRKQRREQTLSCGATGGSVATPLDPSLASMNGEASRENALGREAEVPASLLNQLRHEWTAAHEHLQHHQCFLKCSDPARLSSCAFNKTPFSFLFPTCFTLFDINRLHADLLPSSTCLSFAYRSDDSELHFRGSGSSSCFTVGGIRRDHMATDAFHKNVAAVSTKGGLAATQCLHLTPSRTEGAGNHETHQHQRERSCKGQLPLTHVPWNAQQPPQKVNISKEEQVIIYCLAALTHIVTPDGFYYNYATLNAFLPLEDLPAQRPVFLYGISPGAARLSLEVETDRDRGFFRSSHETFDALHNGISCLTELRRERGSPTHSKAPFYISSINCNGWHTQHSTSFFSFGMPLKARLREESSFTDHTASFYVAFFVTQPHLSSLKKPLYAKGDQRSHFARNGLTGRSAASGAVERHALDEERRENVVVARLTQNPVSETLLLFHFCERERSWSPGSIGGIITCGWKERESKAEARQFEGRHFKIQHAASGLYFALTTDSAQNRFSTSRLALNTTDDTRAALEIEDLVAKARVDRVFSYEAEGAGRTGSVLPDSMAFIDGKGQELHGLPDTHEERFSATAQLRTNLNFFHTTAAPSTLRWRPSSAIPSRTSCMTAVADKDLASIFVFTRKESLLDFMAACQVVSEAK